MQLRILSASDIDQALSMREAIEVNAQAYAMLSSGEAEAPARIALQADNGVTLVMPGYLPATGALGVKVVSVYEPNRERGLPTIHAVVLALECETGRPLALLNGTRLTALRTGAGAGVATQRLAREDARVFAMFGAGAQAMDQVEAVLAVRAIEELRLYTPSHNSAVRLAEQIQPRHPEVAIRVVDTPSQAVRGADIVSCATPSSTPVFDPADIAPGTHINAIGSFQPEKREIQIVGLPNRRLFVDSLEATLDETGDLIQPIAEGNLRPEELTEIGRVIAGQAVGRSGPDDVTVFKSVGVAVQDAATAQAVLTRAVERELGTVLEI